MLNLNLDMLGYAGRSNRLYATYSRADQNLRDVVLDVGKVAPLCLVDGHRKSQRFRLFNEKVNWRKASDHAAFSKAGFRYIFIGGGVHKNYHTPKDTFENIDHDFYVSATETAWLILQAADAS
jgi:Zn-dependent M28 family amino/carboxypeptidase